MSGAIHSLFAPSLFSRMKMFVVNPSHTSSQLPSQLPPQTPNQSFASELTPLVSSTPFSGAGEDSTHTCEEDITVEDRQPVDMIVENPIFGSGLRLRRVRVFWFCSKSGYTGFIFRLIRLL